MYNQKKGSIDSITLSSYEQDFELTYTHNSTAIEGNTLTLIETKVVLEDGISVGGKKLREIYEVVNHKKAYRYVKKCIAEEKKLDEHIVKDLHAILTENIIVGGVYRSEPVRISGAGHTPPVGNDMYIQIKNFYQSRQSTTSIGVTHRMGVGECLFVTYWLLMYSCISCKLFSFAIVVK